MIKRITGKIIEKDLNYIIVDVNGVGYQVFTSAKTMSEISLDQYISLFTFFSVRENSQDLYGFSEKSELDFFELLLVVNGIGPKSAITILSSTNTETLTEGIQTNDPSYLSKISGIGKKTAEKIVLALKDKIGSVENSTENTAGSDAIDALISLGYSQKDARDAISKIKNKGNTEDLIKQALKDLG